MKWKNDYLHLEDIIEEFLNTDHGIPIHPKLITALTDVQELLVTEIMIGIKDD